MEFSLKIEGLDELKRTLSDMGKRQIPYATALAINATAEHILKAEQGTMKQYLHRPVNWTLNSLRIEKATKTKLYGRVWFIDAAGKGTPAYKYLSVQEQGGQRGDKRFERALRYAGYLPPGWYVVPSKYIGLDSHGNLKGPFYVSVLSAIKAHTESGFTANRTERSKKKLSRPKDYFVVRVPGHGGLLPGIYQRVAEKGAGIGGKTGAALKEQGATDRQKGSRAGRNFAVIQQRGAKAIFMFVSKKPSYRPRLPWYPVAQKTFDRHYEREFDKAFELAMRTAR